MYQSGYAVSKIYKCAVWLKAFYNSFCYKAWLDIGNFILSFLFCFFL